MKNLTLTAVNNLTGLSTGNLSDLENDKFMPSANALILFKKLFNVSIDWILTGKLPITSSKPENVNELQSNYLTEEEKEIIYSYRILNAESKRDIKGFINVVTQTKTLNKSEKPTNDKFFKD